MPDVIGYLESKGLHLRRAGGHEVNTPCVFCGENLGSRGRLYVNTDPAAEPAGLFFCHLCGAKGSLASLKAHFGDTAAVTDDDLSSLRRSEVLNAAAAWYHDQLDVFPDVAEYLHGPRRGLRPDTVKAHQLGYAPMSFELDVATGTVSARWPSLLYRWLRDEGYSAKEALGTGLCHERDGRVVDSLAGMITIPYHTAGNVTMIRGRAWPFDETDWAGWAGERYPAPRAKYKTCPGNTSRLFNTDAAWHAEEIFLAEGEMDALVLTQEGLPALGVPGAKAWQDSWDSYLQPLKRVWLVFDRDPAGEDGAAKLTAKLGTKARRVHLSPEGLKCDPTTWFAEQGHTRAEFDELVQAARRGGLLTTVRDAIAEFRDVQSQPGLKFGHELLDLVIEPGLQPAQVMVLLAKTGSGKTVWLLNTMHRMRGVAGQEGLKVLFVSLEQTRGEWWDRARRIHRFYNLDSDEEEAAQWWDDHIWIVDRNRLSEADLRQALDDFEDEAGQRPDLVCLDYLGYFAQGFKGERYQRTSDAVMALKAVAKDYKVPFIVPHQVSRVAVDGEEFSGDAARDSGVISETADFLLTIWSPDNALARSDDEKSGLVNMRIQKSRHGGRGVLLSLQWAPVSLVMVPEGDPLVARARQEHRWRTLYRDNWDKAVYRHRTGFEGHLERTPQLVTNVGLDAVLDWASTGAGR